MTDIARVARHLLTISAGQHTSDAVDNGYGGLRRILVPAGTQGERLRLLHGGSKDGPFFPASRSDGNNIVFAFLAGEAIELDEREADCIDWFKLQTVNFSSVGVSQSAERTIEVIALR